MPTPFRRRFSLAVGWLADRRVPVVLRPLVYRGYCRLTGADLREARLPPRDYPSLGAFFVRRLAPGARPADPDPRALLSPCDGRVQDVRRIEGGMLLQAKGREYPLTELLRDARAAAALEGGWAWTLYLSPRDYHRVHVPAAARLEHVRWIPGARHSVAPAVLARRERVLAENERAVLTLSGARARFHLVLVGALNVGRIRVLGVPPGSTPDPAEPPAFGRADELARFEMGSTVVLLFPPGTAAPRPDLGPGDPVRVGRPIGLLEADGTR